MVKRGLLCISRRPFKDQDCVVVDDRIRIRFTKIEGNQIQLTFENINPDDFVPVCREEVYEGPGHRRTKR